MPVMFKIKAQPWRGGAYVWAVRTGAGAAIDAWVSKRNHGTLYTLLEAQKLINEFKPPHWLGPLSTVVEHEKGKCHAG
jgi:hypothetical protein